MNAEARTSSSPRTAAWIVAVVLVVLPVLYLLSVPPLYPATRRAGAWEKGTGRMPVPPGWLRAYAGPYKFLSQKTPLRRPLEVYRRWWYPSVL